MTIVIETSNLSKFFKMGKNEVEAVQNLNLQVNEGEIFGFLGPNGAGKTTTLRMLTTLLPPSRGEATVAGYNLLQQPERIREQIGYVSQKGGADINATARENLILQARLYGLSKNQAEERSDELLAILELEKIADRPSQTYSGGQMRRLDLAMGIIHRPSLLFLDEPTTGLDPQGRARLWDEVRKLHENGTTIFLTTHYLEEADALCDRLSIIDHGQIVADGTPDSLKQQISGDVIILGLNMNDDESSKVQDMLNNMEFIREVNVEDKGLRLYVNDGEKALPRILRDLDNMQLDIETITLARPSLDDVFLKQTGRSLRDVE